MIKLDVRELCARERTYSITELCKIFDVTPRTLRFYEQKGLLNPNRHGWRRLFSSRDRARLQLILRARRAGFALEEIKEMLDVQTSRGGPVGRLGIASIMMRARLEALQRQRAELETAALDLSRALIVVDTLMARRYSNVSAAAAR